MYLAVASASALPTANTYKKTADTSVTSGKTYYTKSGSTYTAVTSPAEASLGTYYEETTDIGTEITADELSDVTMTKATVGNQAFVTGTTNKADASIAYSLGAATYALKDGEIIDFDTAQGDLATKLEMSVLGGVAGFTLTGAVNADADWSEADAAAITITPTYAVTDATGSEVAVDNAAYNQVNLVPANAAPSVPEKTYVMTAGQDVEVEINLGAGDLAATGVASVSYVAAGKTYSFASGEFKIENGKLVLSHSKTDTFANAGIKNREITILFNDTAKTTGKAILTTTD